MCGRKINKFIDKINNRTKTVNRSLNLSSIIYSSENDRTFAEINNTTHEKMSPVLSITIVKLIGVDVKDLMDHSSRIVELFITVFIVGINIRVKSTQMRIFAVLNKDFVCIIIYYFKYFI